jgi:hypothetical protein
MHQISKEHLAIILEVISFFCVTTDLYGSERLQKLRDRLVERKEDPNNKEPSWGMKIFMAAGAIGALYYFGKALYPDIAQTFTHNNFSHYSWLDWVLLCSVGVALGVLFVVFFSMLFMFIGAMAAAPFSFLPDLMIWILRQILKVVSLEGLLLGIGAIIFLISKFISYGNLA